MSEAAITLPDILIFHLCYTHPTVVTITHNYLDKDVNYAEQCATRGIPASENVRMTFIIS